MTTDKEDVRHEFINEIVKKYWGMPAYDSIEKIIEHELPQLTHQEQIVLCLKLCARIVK